MVERRRTCVERQLAENSLQPDRRPSASVWTNFGTFAQCVEYQRDAFMAVSMLFSRCAEKAFHGAGKPVWEHGKVRSGMLKELFRDKLMPQKDGGHYEKAR